MFNSLGLGLTRRKRNKLVTILLSSTSAYAILDFEPDFVLDFKNSIYKTGGTDTTLSSAVTHARAGNATMVDSDGLLKWAPHNLMRYSEDFTNFVQNDSRGDSSLTFTQITDNTNPVGASSVTKVSPSFVTDPQGSSRNIRIYQNIGATQGNDILSLSVFVKPITTTSTYPADIERDLHLMFAIDNNANSNFSSYVNLNSQVTSGSNVTYTSVGDGWYKATAQLTRNANLDTSTNCYVYLSNRNNATSFDPYPQADLDIRFTGFHTFRSDLGGMVNNPTTSNSYVPTTNSAVYLPRVGHHVYNGSAWANEGILHESEARTNLMTNSGDLTNSDWTSPRLTVGAVTAGSPFGAYQSITPVANGTVKANAYQVGKSITLGATYVGWALVKYSAGSGWFAINMYDTGKGDERAYFDLQNGVVGAKDALIIDHGMVDYGDGWWLCWASANAASGTGGLVVTVTDGNSVVTGSISDTILIAGTQFEEGSTASSYIPTSSSTVTRAAETLTVPAANLPYSSTNVSIQMEGKMTYADTGANTFFYRWLLNSTNYAQAVLQTNGSYEGRIRYSQRETTSGYDELGTSGSYFTPDINVPFNISSRHGSTFLNGAEGGTALTANTTVTALPDLSSNDLLLGSTFMGTIGKFRVWDEDLGDTGIEEAST